MEEGEEKERETSKRKFEEELVRYRRLKVVFFTQPVLIVQHFNKLKVIVTLER